jgi:hypothetical protein
MTQKKVSKGAASAPQATKAAPAPQDVGESVDVSGTVDEIAGLLKEPIKAQKQVQPTRFRCSCGNPKCRRIIPGYDIVEITEDDPYYEQSTADVSELKASASVYGNPAVVRKATAADTAKAVRLVQVGFQPV